MLSAKIVIILQLPKFIWHQQRFPVGYRQYNTRNLISSDFMCVFCVRCTLRFSKRHKWTSRETKRLTFWLLVQDVWLVCNTEYDIPAALEPEPRKVGRHVPQQFRERCVLGLTGFAGQSRSVHVRRSFRHKVQILHKRNHCLFMYLNHKEMSV